MYFIYAEIFAIFNLFKSLDFFLQINPKISPSILPFFPEGLIELSLFESVRLDRDNAIWDINKSVEQKGHHTLCREALLQMLVKHFRNKNWTGLEKTDNLLQRLQLQASIEMLHAYKWSFWILNAD